MGTSLLDTPTKASLDLVKALAKKLNFFINGNGIMQTDSGPVESILHIAKRLSSTGYFHPIQVFESYDEMTLAQLSVDDMGYVQADPVLKKRGLYQVQENGEFKKQSYESIVALSRELGRELLVQDIPVSYVTGPVEVYKLIIPTNVEQTVWVNLRMKAFIPASGVGCEQDVTIIVRINQNGTVQTETIARPPYTTLGALTSVLPVLDYTIATQNQGSEEENRLITVRVKPQVDNVSLATISVLDSSSLVYKA
uniref:Uncharacterized protein n=1 Tax=Pseudomonas phage Cygsa01 TaxID=3138529 RepID=A0AAU6W4K9_9VIRU